MKLVTWLILSSLMSATIFSAGPKPIFSNDIQSIKTSPVVIADALVSHCESGEGRCATEFDGSLTWVKDGEIVLSIKRSPLISAAIDLRIFSISAGARYENCTVAVDKTNFGECVIVVSSSSNRYGEPELPRGFSIETSLGKSLISAQILRSIDWGDLGCVNPECTDTPKFKFTVPPVDLDATPGFSQTAGHVFYNTSKVRASFSNFEISGQASQLGLSIQSNQCEGKVLDPKGSCLLTFLFSPQQYGIQETIEIGSFVGPTGFKSPVVGNLTSTPAPPILLEPRGVAGLLPKFTLRPVGLGEHKLEVEIYRKGATEGALVFERFIRQDDFNVQSFMPGELAVYDTEQSEKFSPGCYSWRARSTITSQNLRSDWSGPASFCIDESEIQPIELSENDLYTSINSIGAPGSSTLQILHHPSWNSREKTPILLSKESQKIIRPTFVSDAGELEGYPSVFATFEVQSEDLGEYVLASIPANSSGEVSIAAVVIGPKSSTIEVKENQDAGKRILDWNFLTPAGTRTGSEDAFEVAYRNRSSTDIASPIAIISMNRPGTVNVNGRREFVGSEVQVIAASSIGPAGILRNSGPTERIKFDFTAAEEGQYVIGAQIVHSRNSELIDWPAIESQVRPEGLDDRTWASSWQSFVSRAGDTWGSYVQALADVITQNELAGKRYSRPILVADVLSDYLASGVQGTFKNAIGSVSLEERPLQAAFVQFESITTGLTFETETKQDGTFVTPLPAGQYSISVQGYLNSQEQEVTISKDRDTRNIQIKVSNGSRITGKVTREIGGAITQDELVTVSLIKGSEVIKSLSVFGSGEFSFSGLAAGNYQIGLTSRGWAEAQPVEQRVGNNASVELNLVLHEPRAIRGRVLDKNGAALADASAILLDQSGNFISISQIDTNGIYSFSRLQPGSYITEVYFGEKRLIQYQTKVAASDYVINNRDLKIENSLSLDIQIQGTKLNDEVLLIIEDLVTNKVLATRSSRVGKREQVNGLTNGTLRITALSPGGAAVDSITLKKDSALVIDVPDLQTQSSFQGSLSQPNERLGNGIRTNFIRSLYDVLIPPTPSRSPLEKLLDDPPPAPCPEAENARNNLLRWKIYLQASFEAWEANFNAAKYGAVITASTLAIQIVNLVGSVYVAQARVAAAALRAAALGEGSKFLLVKTLALVEGAISLTNGIQDAVRSGDYFDIAKTSFSAAERLWNMSKGLSDELSTIEDIAKGADIPIGGIDAWALLKNIIGLQEIVDNIYQSIKSHQATVSNANNAQAQYEAGVKKMVDAYNRYLQAIIDCGKKTLPIRVTPKPPCRTCEVNYCPWIESNSSFDPNDKLTSGYGEKRFLAPKSHITYTIRFENIAEATAAARLVSIQDKLETNLDWSTLELINVTISNKRFDFEPQKISQDLLVNVPNDPYPVRVETAFDPSSGLLSLLMRSWDPSNSSFPRNTLAGFLPPNDDTSKGEGSFTFRVKPFESLAPDMKVLNQAEIVFDTNEAIMTNVTSNEFDSQAPETRIIGLWDYSPGEFTLKWESSDGDGSGSLFYDVYAAVNNSEFQLYRAGVSETEIKVQGEDGDKFSFYVLATDGVGNTEEFSTDRVKTTTIGLDPRLLLIPLLATLIIGFLFYRKRVAQTKNSERKKVATNL
jgi:hypothetical protein